MVVIIVVPAPGGGRAAGTPRPTPNPVVPENPRLSFSRSLTPLRQFLAAQQPTALTLILRHVIHRHLRF